MGRYFVRGRSPHGRTTTDRVYARDTAAATEQLRARGYSELEAGSVPEGEKLPAAEHARMAFRGDWYPGWIVVTGLKKRAVSIRSGSNAVHYRPWSRRFSKS
jgi:hypothetical protein